MAAIVSCPKHVFRALPVFLSLSVAVLFPDRVAAKDLVNDPFTDGGYTAGADPADTNWWAIGPVGLGTGPFAASGNTSTGLVFNASSTYAATSCSLYGPLALGVGDSIALSFDFRFTSATIPTDSTGWGWRFGIGSSSNTYTLCVGTGATTGFSVNAFPTNQVSGNPYTVLTTGGTAIAINDNVTHTAVMKLIRTAASTLTVTATIDGVHTFTGTHTGVTNFTFVRGMWGTGNVNLDFHLDNVVIVETPGTTTLSEAETLGQPATPNDKSSGDTIVAIPDANLSGGNGEQLTCNAVGDFVTYSVPIAQPGHYAIKVKIKKAANLGKFGLEVDGKPQGVEQDEYSAAASYAELSLGNKFFGTSGTKAFKFKVTGKNVSSTGYNLALDCIKLVDASVYKRPISGIGLNGADGSVYPYVNYKMPNDAMLARCQELGINVMRVSFRWEYLQPTPNAPFDAAKLDEMKTFMALARTRGVNVLWNMHNFSKRYGILLNTAAERAYFADFWRRFATEFKNDEYVAMHGLMNEPAWDGITHSDWKLTCQAAVDAIRSVDVRTPIAVPGQGSTAWDWAKAPPDNKNADMSQVVGTYLVFEAHQYPDWGNAGTFPQADPWATLVANSQSWCPDTHDYLWRICKNYFDWLANNNARGFLGETGQPSGLWKGSGAWAPHSKYRSDWTETIRRTCDLGMDSGIPVFLWCNGVHFEANSLVITHLRPYTEDPIQVMIKTTLAGKPPIQ